MNRQRMITGLLTIALIIVVVLVAAGCSDDDDATTDTTTSTSSTSTTTATSTSSTSTTDTSTTTTSVTSTSTTTSTTTSADQTATDLLADGSGCTPAADVLPDGLWFGFVDQADQTEISFDLACWFTGEAAATAAAEDGEESPPPNDYHIRNRNDRRRAVPVELSATVSWLPSPGDPATTEEISYDRWLVDRAGRDFQPGVWLQVTDGRAVTIEEQYVP